MRGSSRLPPDLNTVSTARPTPVAPVLYPRRLPWLGAAVALEERQERGLGLDCDDAVLVEPDVLEMRLRNCRSAVKSRRRLGRSNRAAKSGRCPFDFDDGGRGFLGGVGARSCGGSSRSSFNQATGHAPRDGPFCADEGGIARRTTRSHKALELSDGRPNRGPVAVSRDGAFVCSPTVVGDRGERRFGLRLHSCVAVSRRCARNGPVRWDDNRLRPRGAQVLSGMQCESEAGGLFRAGRIALTRPKVATDSPQRCRAAAAARECQPGDDRQSSRLPEHWRSLHRGKW